jgi:hypothetical protein
MNETGLQIESITFKSSDFLARNACK